MLAPRWRAASRISSPATTSPTRRARRTFLTRRRGSRVAKDEKPQLVDYQTAERLPVIRDADWAMVLGADEFLNIHIGRGTVCDLLEAVPDSTASSSNGACSAAPDTRRGNRPLCASGSRCRLRARSRGWPAGMPIDLMIWNDDPPHSSKPACLAVKAAEMQSPSASG